MASFPGISVPSLRTYLTRLPFLTLLISGLCVLLWLVECVTWLPVGAWLNLDPAMMGLSQCKFDSPRNGRARCKDAIGGVCGVSWERLVLEGRGRDG